MREPPDGRKVLDAAVHEAVWQISIAVEERDREHAHVHRGAARVIADDELREGAVEVLEAIHRVPVVPLPEAPVGDPRALRHGLAARHPPTSTRIAPNEMPAPTPTIRIRWPGRTSRVRNRRSRLMGIAAAPTLPR